MAGGGKVLLATAAMGTRFEVVIPGEESAALRAVGEGVIAEIERLHRLLSRFAPDSLLSHINRNAFHAAVRVDLGTFALLQDARDVWRASSGAFDISCGTGMDAVLLDADARTVRFTRRGVQLDLGGIAKGHAVDLAAAFLREHGVASALVHGGTSSVAAIGTPPEDAAGWRIAIAPSMKQTVTLFDNTLSVSSGALRDHIIDPSTGAYVTGPRLAAVVGPSARLGDAWSTALAVLGARPSALGPEWTTIIE